MEGASWLAAQNSPRKAGSRSSWARGQMENP